MDVDIKRSGTDYYIADIAAGEYLRYTVYVAEDGTIRKTYIKYYIGLHLSPVDSVALQHSSDGNCHVPSNDATTKNTGTYGIVYTFDIYPLYRHRRT